MDTSTLNLKDSICWPAIFAGVVMALVATALLNMLGVGMGFSMLDLNRDSMSNVGIGTFIWFVLSGTFSMFLGGWFVGYLGKAHSRVESMLQGVVMWGLTTLLVLAVTTATFGVFVGSSINILGHAVTQGGKAISSVSKNLNTGMPIGIVVGPEIDSMVQSIQQEVSLNKDVGRSLQETVTTLFVTQDEQAFSESREKLIQLLAQNTNLDTQQAEQKVNEWARKINEQKEQIKQKVGETTEKTVNVLGATALTTFFILLIGAVASAFGGICGYKSIAKVS